MKCKTFIWYYSSLWRYYVYGHLLREIFKVLNTYIQFLMLCTFKINNGHTSILKFIRNYSKLKVAHTYKSIFDSENTHWLMWQKAHSNNSWDYFFSGVISQKARKSYRRWSLHKKKSQVNLVELICSQICRFRMIL